MKECFLDIELAQKINQELMRARQKFPGNENLTVALIEEVGELAAAQLQSKSYAEIEAEAIQVIAVCLRIVFERDCSIPRIVAAKEK